MAEKNCENCAREDCAFIPPVGKVHCDYWHSDAPAVNRWIPCSERLPEQGEEVWCCCYGSDIVIPDYEHGETVAECIARTQKEIVNVRLGFLGSDGWYTIEGYPMIIAPTYWMSLNKPEPPEKE